MTRIKHKARAYLEAAIAAQRQPWQGRQQDEEAAVALALRDRLLVSVWAQREGGG